MKFQRIIQKRLRDDDAAAVADLNAAITVNVGEAGAQTHNTTHQHVVQTSRGARTHTTVREMSGPGAPPSATANAPKEQDA